MLSASFDLTMSSQSETPSAEPDRARSKVLIIGAGITGLVLGQALKQHGIAFSIFEKDPSISAREGGWGLTIAWALETLITLLPQHVVNRLPEAYVDPEASEKGVNGNFLFFDLRSGEARWKVPPTKRIRVSRQRLRTLLLDGLDVQVSRMMARKRRFLQSAVVQDTNIYHHGRQRLFRPSTLLRLLFRLRCPSYRS